MLSYENVHGLNYERGKEFKGEIVKGEKSLYLFLPFLISCKKPARNKGGKSKCSNNYLLVSRLYFRSWTSV